MVWVYHMLRPQTEACIQGEEKRESADLVSGLERPGVELAQVFQVLRMFSDSFNVMYFSNASTYFWYGSQVAGTDELRKEGRKRGVTTDQELKPGLSEQWELLLKLQLGMPKCHLGQHCSYTKYILLPQESPSEELALCQEIRGSQDWTGDILGELTQLQELAPLEVVTPQGQWKSVSTFSVLILKIALRYPEWVDKAFMQKYYVPTMNK